MKCLALWQPWASLWLTDRKIHETRDWSTPYRGWLAVHAAKKIESDYGAGDELGDILIAEFGSDWAKQMPLGAIIGAVNITSCLQMKFTSPEHQDDMYSGNWHDERYAWRRGEVVKLEKPIPFVGRQKIFNIPDDISIQILDARSAA